jgi:phosphoglycolate phosphatase-like HAD superfamily hydrolase
VQYPMGRRALAAYPSARSMHTLTAIRAVLFDWRGTLVVTMTDAEWVKRAHGLAGRTVGDSDAIGTVEALQKAQAAVRRDVPWDRIDCDAKFHRFAHDRMFAVAGLDADLADALYAVESDPECNPFAADTAVTLAALKSRGLRWAF